MHQTGAHMEVVSSPTVQPESITPLPLLDILQVTGLLKTHGLNTGVNLDISELNPETLVLSLAESLMPHTE